MQSHTEFFVKEEEESIKWMDGGGMLTQEMYLN